MNTIDLQKHTELIKLLTELSRVVDEMKKESSDILLTWLQNEIHDWVTYLEKHKNKEELKSLEIEIGDRFFHTYNVRIEPAYLDRQRLKIFQDIIALLNSSL